MTDADPNDSSQAADEGTPAEDTDEEEKEAEEDQEQYGGEDGDIDPVEQTERQDGSRNDADESED